MCESPDRVSMNIVGYWEFIVTIVRLVTRAPGPSAINVQAKRGIGETLFREKNVLSSFVPE
jgi:hypothetical protein